MGSCLFCDGSDETNPQEVIPKPTIFHQCLLTFVSYIKPTRENSYLAALLAEVPRVPVTRLTVVKHGENYDAVIIEAENPLNPGVAAVLETFDGEVLVQYGTIEVMAALMAKEPWISEEELSVPQPAVTMKALLLHVHRETQQRHSQAFASTGNVLTFLQNFFKRN